MFSNYFIIITIVINVILIISCVFFYRELYKIKDKYHRRFIPVDRIAHDGQAIQHIFKLIGVTSTLNRVKNKFEYFDGIDLKSKIPAIEAMVSAHNKSILQHRKKIDVINSKILNHEKFLYSQKFIEKIAQSMDLMCEKYGDKAFEKVMDTPVDNTINRKGSGIHFSLEYYSDAINLLHRRECEGNLSDPENTFLRALKGIYPIYVNVLESLHNVKERPEKWKVG